MRNKKRLYIILGILMVILLIPMTILMSVREEFKDYINEAHQDKTFAVNFFVLYDPIYERYVTHVTCLEDNTEFTISKSKNSKDISDNYLNQKNQNDYNGLLNDIFEQSIIKKYIKSVTGSGKMPLDIERIYEQINFYLPETVNHSEIIKDSLILLKENNIFCTNIIYVYEKDMALYRIKVDSDNYDLTQDEIEVKTVKIK